MAGEDNILSHKIRSAEEAREKGKKGGRASGASRRKKRYLRDILAKLLAAKSPDQNISNDEAITVALIGKALSGDVKAYEAIRDTMGEKPTEKAKVEQDTTMRIVWSEQ